MAALTDSTVDTLPIHRADESLGAEFLDMDLELAAGSSSCHVSVLASILGPPAFLSRSSSPDPLGFPAGATPWFGQDANATVNAFQPLNTQTWEAFAFGEWSPHGIPHAGRGSAGSGSASARVNTMAFNMAVGSTARPDRRMAQATLAARFLSEQEYNALGCVVHTAPKEAKLITPHLGPSASMGMREVFRYHAIGLGIDERLLPTTVAVVVASVSGYFVDCNQATLALLECQKEDIVGKTPHQLSCTPDWTMRTHEVSLLQRGQRHLLITVERLRSLGSGAIHWMRFSFVGSSKFTAEDTFHYGTLVMQPIPAPAAGSHIVCCA
jgi:PAS domain-containing protein